MVHIMRLAYGYQGMTAERYGEIRRKEVLDPNTRLDIFENRHAPRENLIIRKQLERLVIPDFAYDWYSFFIRELGAEEEYYDKIPKDPRYDKARNFFENSLTKD